MFTCNPQDANYKRSMRVQTPWLLGTTSQFWQEIEGALIEYVTSLKGWNSLTHYFNLQTNCMEERTIKTKTS